MKQYTAIVIGAGPAGETCAVRLAQLGAKVAIVERDYIGGICTNWGCTPSKAMIESAKMARTIRESGRYGIHVPEPRIDFAEVAARRDQVIMRARDLVAELFLRHDIDTYQGEAHILGPGRVLVRRGKLHPDGREMSYTGEEEELQAEHIVLATGSQPLIPDDIGADNPFIISSNRLITIGELPKRLTIVGGGVIGVELATIFSNLGSQVTIIEYGDRVLGGMDPEISAELTDAMTTNGVRILARHRLVSVEAGAACVANRDTDEILTVSSDAILIAIGRKPVINREMFDRLGIAYTPKGIGVDEFMRTNVPGVWAVGDATGRSILAHAGIQQGVVCAENMMAGPAGELRPMRYDVIPAVIYSIPEVVGVGFVPPDVSEVEIYKVPFTANMRARIEGFDGGFLKIWVKDERILAAQMIGNNVSELMQEIANMVAMKTRLSDVANVIHAHPTYSEITRSILEYALDRQVDFYGGTPEFEVSMYRPASEQLVTS